MFGIVVYQKWALNGTGFVKLLSVFVYWFRGDIQMGGGVIFVCSMIWTALFAVPAIYIIITYLAHDRENLETVCKVLCILLQKRGVSYVAVC